MVEVRRDGEPFQREVDKLAVAVVELTARLRTPRGGVAPVAVAVDDGPALRIRPGDRVEFGRQVLVEELADTRSAVT